MQPDYHLKLVKKFHAIRGEFWRKCWLGRGYDQTWTDKLVHGGSVMSSVYSVGTFGVQAHLEPELSLISLDLPANILNFRRKVPWSTVPWHCVGVPLNFPLSPTDPSHPQTTVVSVPAYPWNSSDSSCTLHVLLAPILLSLLTDRVCWLSHQPWHPLTQYSEPFTESDNLRVHSGAPAN